MARRRRSAEEQLADQVLDNLLSSPGGRRFLLIVIVVALLFFAGFWLWQNRPRAHGVAGPTVRLATWNLRQFSDHRKEVDLAHIAQIIQQNHFDLVAIQEVKRDGQEVNRLVETLGSPWRAARFSDTTGNYERFAFIYNADHVQEIGTPHFMATTDAIIFDRTPYQDTFKAGDFDFTMVEVHLSYTNMQRRQHEAQALLHYALNLEGTTAAKDVIVCGDFNEQPPHGNLHYFIEAGWESLNHDPTNLGGTEVYDTFLIDPRITHEWTGVSASVHFEHQYFAGNTKLAEEAVSDHRPAYADFSTTVKKD